MIDMKTLIGVVVLVIAVAVVVQGFRVTSNKKDSGDKGKTDDMSTKKEG